MFRDVRVTSSRPYGTFRPSNLYPGLRPGLSSARAVQISWLADSVGLILMVKLRLKRVMGNQVEFDRESARLGALYQGTTLVGPFQSRQKLGFSPCVAMLNRHLGLGFVAVLAVCRG